MGRLCKHWLQSSRPMIAWRANYRVNVMGVDQTVAHVNTHGKKYFVMGGSHVCSDDFFKAQALQVREEKIEERTKLKKKLLEKAVLCNKGMTILVTKATFFEANNYR